MSVSVLKEIFYKALEAVRPENLIRNQIRVTSSALLIQNQTYPIHKPLYVVGFGKAVYGMALELEKLLADKLQMGLVTIPKGISRKDAQNSKIKFIEGAMNNLPDESAMMGALEIKQLVENLTIDDFLLVLISGGGSALLPLPKPPITLKEKQCLIRELSRKGANILELNAVRKKISVLKGGGLAELAFPAKVVSLVLSDVVGDPLDFIASGPTAPCDDNNDPVTIIQKYNCYDTLPESIRTVVTTRTPKKPHNADNFIIGNNKMASAAALQHATSMGFQSAILSTTIAGDVGGVSEIYADLARHLTSLNKQELERFLGSNFVENFAMGKEVCIISSGEPTVVVNGNGRGGRNQQLALELAVKLNKLNIKSDISFLSCGTDGMDGPTDAAGAIGTSDLVYNSLVENIKVDDYLKNNDCYSFFERFRGGEYLIKTGHTGTNVMDIHIMIMKPKC